MLKTVIAGLHTGEFTKIKNGTGRGESAWEVAGGDEDDERGLQYLQR